MLVDAEGASRAGLRKTLNSDAPLQSIDRRWSRWRWWRSAVTMLVLFFETFPGMVLRSTPRTLMLSFPLAAMARPSELKGCIQAFQG